MKIRVAGLGPLRGHQSRQALAEPGSKKSRRARGLPAPLPRYDVLVESFRPGVLARLGLGIEVLHQHHPALVICSITGYGQAGPYRDRAGHDLNYLAIAGVLGLVGESSERPPHPMPIQLADLGAGALWPAVQILAALRQAEREDAAAILT